MRGPYEREVYYYETDRMQIVHHSNYIKWLEEARLWFMRDFGYDYARIEEQGILIPVLSVETTYRKAFKYGDVFQIYTSSRHFNGVKCCFEYEIRNKATGELHSTAKSSHCFVDTELRPINLKKKFPEIYEAFLAQVEKEN